MLERKWLRLRVHMNERRTTSLARVGPTVELVEHFLFACGRTAFARSARSLHAGLGECEIGIYCTVPWDDLTDARPGSHIWWQDVKTAVSSLAPSNFTL